MEIRKSKKEDVDKIFEIINNVDKSKKVFIKSTRNEIEEKIEKSFVCVYRDKIVGVCLIVEDKDLYIDTIVSTKKGAGSKLLSSLKEGVYRTNISKINNESICLFRKFGFVKIGKEIVEKEEREIYEGLL